MRILIRTFPPNHNPNYGGILQAWALQSTLKSLGHTVATDATKSSAQAPLIRWARRRATVTRDLVARLGLLKKSSQQAAVSWAATRNLLSFAPRAMTLDFLYCGRNRVDPKVLRRYDAFLVGSDQVWRPDLVDMPSYLLNFLPEKDSRTRVAYAASFGMDSPAGLDSEPTRSEHAKLIERFNHVSVREVSGVALSRALWGRTAERTIDPTMLITSDQYRQLADGHNRTEASGNYLSAYVLDSSDEKSAISALVASELRLEIDQLYRPLPSEYLSYKNSRDYFDRPSVESWLQSIADSKFVVTDSYHGAVFAILFNRPFLVIPNARRGLARFDTLLSTFGLLDRVSKQDGRDLVRASAVIDWTSVNAVIKVERERGMDFLRSSFSHS